MHLWEVASATMALEESLVHSMNESQGSKETSMLDEACGMNLGIWKAHHHA